MNAIDQTLASAVERECNILQFREDHEAKNERLDDMMMREVKEARQRIRRIRKAAADEVAKLKDSAADAADAGNAVLLKRAQKLLSRDDNKLEPAQLAEIESVLAQHQSLSTLVQMRAELARLWESSSASSEQLLADLQAWCQRAQQSGIESLEQFALRLRRYAA